VWGERICLFPFYRSRDPPCRIRLRDEFLFLKLTPVGATSFPFLRETPFFCRPGTHLLLTPSLNNGLEEDERFPSEGFRVWCL